MGAASFSAAALRGGLPADMHRVRLLSHGYEVLFRVGHRPLCHGHPRALAGVVAGVGARFGLAHRRAARAVVAPAHRHALLCALRRDARPDSVGGFPAQVHVGRGLLRGDVPRGVVLLENQPAPHSHGGRRGLACRHERRRPRAFARAVRRHRLLRRGVGFRPALPGLPQRCADLRRVLRRILRRCVGASVPLIFCGHPPAGATRTLGQAWRWRLS